MVAGTAWQALALVIVALSTVAIAGAGATNNASHFAIATGAETEANRAGIIEAGRDPHLLRGDRPDYPSGVASMYRLTDLRAGWFRWNSMISASSVMLHLSDIGWPIARPEYSGVAQKDRVQGAYTAEQRARSTQCGSQIADRAGGRRLNVRDASGHEIAIYPGRSVANSLGMTI